MSAVYASVLAMVCASEPQEAKPDATPQPVVRTRVMRVSDDVTFPRLMRDQTFTSIPRRTPTWPRRPATSYFRGRIPSRRFHTNYAVAPRFVIRRQTYHFAPRVAHRPQYRYRPMDVHFPVTYPATRFRIIRVPGTGRW